MDAGERGRNRRCLPVHLRDGGSGWLSIRRANGASVEPSTARPALHRALAPSHLRPTALVPRDGRGAASHAGRAASRCSVTGDRGDAVPPGRAPTVAGRARRRHRRLPEAAAGRLRRGAGGVGRSGRVRSMSDTMMTQAQPVTSVEAALDRIAADGRDGIWIELLDAATVIGAARRVEQRLAAGEVLPLAGRTVAVKGNIDVAGVPTTAGC